MIQPFELNIEEATRIYNVLKEAGCKFSDSWSPESHERAIRLGRKSDEFMTIMNPTPEQRELLKRFNFDGALGNSWPGLCVQKHGLWLCDIHEMATPEEKKEMDDAWIEMGGWVKGR